MIGWHVSELWVLKPKNLKDLGNNKNKIKVGNKVHKIRDIFKTCCRGTNQSW